MRHFHHCIHSSNYLSYSRFHCSETYSYSRFHCSETRVIFITGYAAVTTLVIPASTEVKHASFSSLYTRSSNYLSYSRFHCSETYSYSRFHCSETRVIFITRYAAVTTLVIPASIAVILASFSSPDSLKHVLIVIPVSTAVKHASFSSTDTSKARLLIFQLPFKGNPRHFHHRIFSSNNFS